MTTPAIETTPLPLGLTAVIHLRPETTCRICEHHGRNVNHLGYCPTCYTAKDPAPELSFE
ncbi:hypothetical protein R4172_05595 [Rhodococcus kroppenstedtii]|nr:hypothetical protein [Rhodococcus kroppenstedtii]